MAAKTFYVTTPIYYVNDVPHVGHAYTTTLADVIARFRRGLGQEVHFLTGTDEHGQKVQEAAAKRGVSPQAHCDELQQRFRDAWVRLGIRPDDFIRTTEPRHESVVQAVLSDLWKRGEIYAGDYEGWYHVSDEVFVTDKDIEEKKLDRTKLRRIVEKNYFFRMGKYRDRLRGEIESGTLKISPEHRKNEVLGFLAKDLDDLCISRPKARLAWGIPLPFDADYVTYVWFDALLNYVSATGYGTDDTSFRRLWPADLHLMGKDILTTHAVYWPTMLMAAGIPRPKEILAHGWWNLSGAKMSKSVGNVVDPLSYAEKYGPDALRYFLVREMVVGQDADFSDDRFRARYDADLGNTWGNLLSRTLNMIGRYAGGKVPAPAGESGANEFRAWAHETRTLLDGWIDRVELHLVAERAMEAFRAANLLAETTQPWKAAKDPSKAALVSDVLYRMAESVRVGSALLAPIVPIKAAEALTQLGAPPAADLSSHLAWGVLKPGTPTAPGPVLFPRLDA